VLAESFADGDDFNDADKWHHHDTETEVLHNGNKYQLLAMLRLDP